MGNSVVICYALPYLQSPAALVFKVVSRERERESESERERERGGVSE